MHSSFTSAPAPGDVKALRPAPESNRRAPLTKSKKVLLRNDFRAEKLRILEHPNEDLADEFEPKEDKCLDGGTMWDLRLFFCVLDFFAASQVELS